jgi:hypothetical protein
MLRVHNMFIICSVIFKNGYEVEIYEKWKSFWFCDILFRTQSMAFISPIWVSCQPHPFLI